jgi:integrase
VAGLPWSETDLDRGVITIRETRPGDDADADDPKSEAGERTIALSALLVALLRTWRKRQLSLAAGVDIKIVQEMLGHATSAFTRDVYTSVVPEIATAAAEAVAAIVPRRAINVPATGA